MDFQDAFDIQYGEMLARQIRHLTLARDHDLAHIGRRAGIAYGETNLEMQKREAQWAKEVHEACTQTLEVMNRTVNAFRRIAVDSVNAFPRPVILEAPKSAH